MQIEVGKTYRTRDGRTVTITRYNEQSHPYLYYGVLNDNSGGGEWTAEGMFYEGEVDNRDLVEEVQGAEATAEAPRPTPAMRQQAIFEAMDFRDGDKVVIVAKIEEANGARCSWNAHMEPLMANKVVGTAKASSAWDDASFVYVNFNEEDGSDTWAFLPQCLEHYTPKPETIELNSSYNATVSPQQRRITVGCQNIDIDNVRKVVEVWERLNPASK